MSHQHAKCLCCEKPLLPFFNDRRAAVSHCAGCGTYRVLHKKDTSAAEMWKAPGITENFLASLGFRRRKQGEQIIAFFKPHLYNKKLLDYGCGQGLFLQLLLNAGFEAYGADLSMDVVRNEIPAERLIRLNRPWELPAQKFDVVCMLDVLEHAASPDALLQEIGERGCRYLLVKVPLIEGPIAMIARFAVVMKQTALMHSLLLTGDNSPHYSFFSTKGLTALCDKSGFKRIAALKLADVGPELPKRLRGSWAGAESSRGRHLITMVLTAFGAILQALAPFWSDTAVFLFERKDDAMDA